MVFVKINLFVLYYAYFYYYYYYYYRKTTTNRYNGEMKRDFEKEIKISNDNIEHYMSDSDINFRRRSVTLPSGALAFNTTTNVVNEKSKDELRFIKGDNLTFKSDLKVVKFVDTPINDDSKLLNRNSHNMSQNRSDYTKTQEALKIDDVNGNDKYYSTTKLPITETKENKKPFVKEALSPIPNTSYSGTSNYSNNNFNSYSYNDLAYESSTPSNSLIQKSGSAKDLAYTPSKTLRLEDFQFDKPNFNVVDTDLLNQVQSNHNQNRQYNGQQQLNGSLTPEFSDCLQLLNEAESKIQSRSSPYVSKYQANNRPQSLINGSSGSQPTTSILKTSSILPDKYTRPQSHQSQQRLLNNTSEVTTYNGNFTSNSKLVYSQAPLNGAKAASNHESQSYNNLSSYRSRSVEPLNNINSKN
jgi:hypothetical protein